MTPPTLTSQPHLARRRHQSGSAVIAALAILAVTFVAVGSALFEASHRFRASHQSSRWSQALHAAEAGAEIALMSAQKDSWAADGWSGAPGAPGDAPVTKVVALDAGVPATGPISASVSVDRITMGSTDWLRIRSKGMAEIASAAGATADFRDVLLRKLSLRTDRDTGAALSAPIATRTVEILAEPTSKSPFQRAILLEKKITMSGGGWIDSFDSGDPTKSTGGLYDIAKRQSHGNVGVNDTEGSSNLDSTYVYGEVAYSGPDIQNTANVQGTISAPFSEPVAPVPAPTWTTFHAAPSSIGNSMTLTGGPQSAPARYKVSSMNVPGGEVVTLAPHAVGEESFVEIWVTGSFTTSGSGHVVLEPGVHAIYHIEGDITVSGSSFVNQSNRSAHNVINAVSPAVATPKSVTISGGGTFIGAINAPAYEFTISGSAEFSGAMIGKTMNISGGASLHFDESLASAPGIGSTPVFRVASWAEAVR